MSAAALKTVESVRRPVTLRHGDLVRVGIEGNSFNRWHLKTRASREEILAAGFFDDAGHILCVDDEIVVRHGPHPFDCDVMVEQPASKYAGGARPHERLELVVVSKVPDETKAGARRWCVRVEPM